MPKLVIYKSPLRQPAEGAFVILSLCGIILINIIKTTSLHMSNSMERGSLGVIVAIIALVLIALGGYYYVANRDTLEETPRATEAPAVQ